jgi:hypothetical protein
MKCKSIFVVSLVIPFLITSIGFASGVGDICIYLNSGTNEVYLDQNNTVEIWIENDALLNGMQFGLEFYWDPSVTITWNIAYGAYPPIDEHGRAVGAWDLTGVMNNNDFNNISPDHIGIGGAAIAAGLTPGPSEFCYSLEFYATGPPGVITDGFSVQPYFYPPSISWLFGEQGSGYTYPPDYCGYTISDPNNPVAPPQSFDIIGPPDCGDINGDASINVIDLAYLIEYMFIGGPPPIGDADVDECGSVNIADVLYLISYLFLMGPPPCGGSVTCNLPAGSNSIDLGCPVTVNPNGDSIPIPIYITNDTPLQALSLGLQHNSPDIEITSISYDGTVLPYDYLREVSIDLANKQVIIYWVNMFSDLPVQSGGLLGTLWAQVPLGTPDQDVDIEVVFIPPSTEFILCPVSGGTIDPAFNDCGTADLVIYTPPAHVCGDVDCSSAVDIDDVVYLIAYIFSGGPPPCDPDDDGTPNCGN